MEKIKVNFWYTVYGLTMVEADDQEQAEKKLQQKLGEEGLEGLDFNQFERDYGV